MSFSITSYVLLLIGVFKLLESNPKALKDSLISRCAHILAVYRKHCASPTSTGQLILPECMKLLPLYVNCLLKSDALFGGKLNFHNLPCMNFQYQIKSTY